MKGVDPGKPSEIEFFYREESGKEFKVDEGCELVGVDKKAYPWSFPLSYHKAVSWSLVC